MADNPLREYELRLPVKARYVRTKGRPLSEGSYMVRFGYDSKVDGVTAVWHKWRYHEFKQTFKPIKKEKNNE